MKYPYNINRCSKDLRNNIIITLFRIMKMFPLYNSDFKVSHRYSSCAKSAQVINLRLTSANPRQSSEYTASLQIDRKPII